MVRRLALVGLISTVSPAFAAEVARVDASGAASFTSIQAAIDEAPDGAQVLIAPGLYRECLTLTDRTLRLVGLGGAAETLVVCEQGPALRWEGGVVQVAHLSLRATGGAAAELIDVTGAATDLLLRSDGVGVQLSEATVRLERALIEARTGLMVKGGALDLFDVEIDGGVHGLVATEAELTARRLRVHGQRSAVDGGALVLTDVQARLVDAELFDVEAVRGAGLWMAGGEVSLVGCDLRDLLAGQGGAGVVGAGATLVLVGSLVRDAEATGDAGGFLVEVGGALDLRGSLLQGLVAAGDGAAVHASGEFIAWDSTIEDGRAGGDGGAIAARAGGLSLVSSMLSGNRAGGDGGAVSVVGISPVIEGCTLEGNAAQNGGAISLSQAGAVTLVGGMWADNDALGDGGALRWVDGEGSLTVLGGTWSGNAALGGGAFDLAVDDVRFDGARLIGNAAFDGGAARVEGGALTLRSTVVLGNDAVREGGGLAVRGASRVVVEDSSLRSNTADRHGGLALWSSEAEVVRSAACANHGADGGGLYAEDSVLSLSNVLLAVNVEGGKGGGAGLMTEGMGSLTATQVTWLENRSTASDARGHDGLFVGEGGAATLRNSAFIAHNAYYFSTQRFATALSSGAAGSVSYDHLGFWDNGTDVATLAVDAEATGVITGVDPGLTGWTGACGGAPPVLAGWAGLGDPASLDRSGGPSTPGVSGGPDAPVDGDGDGVFPWDGDCDDEAVSRAPGLIEIAGDGLDQDCDGSDLRDADGDGFDGVDAGGTDCDDGDPAVHPRAEDPTGDEVDGDCDGEPALDADGDGLSAARGDCDDARSDVHPAAVDRPYDGLDADCDGADEDDADGDGHAAEAFGGADCDDARADVNPDVQDEPYDGLDADCSGDNDRDADGDGQNAEELGGNDCDDADASVFLGAAEVEGDGRDNDCDGLIDEGEVVGAWGCQHGAFFGPWWVVLLAWRRRWAR
jgi:hypothetical protein